MANATLEETLADERREGHIREIEARIGEAGVKHVYLQYTSVPGRVIGKVMPARHFKRIAGTRASRSYRLGRRVRRRARRRLIGPDADASPRDC